MSKAVPLSVALLCGFGLLIPVARFNTSAAEHETAFQWDLPKGFPKPRVPADNPMTAAKVELGQYLFYDVRMSVNGKTSCASCHKQELAFTDGRPTGQGATGELHTRGAMSLINVAYSAALTWSNPQMTELEEQVLVPMFSEHPIELGLREEDSFPPRLRADAKYRLLFARAFPGDAERFTIRNVTKALASFERSIVSARSPYDRYITAARTAPYPNPPSEARPFFSIGIFPAFDATAVSISAGTRFLKGVKDGKSNSITRGYTT